MLLPMEIAPLTLLFILFIRQSDYQHILFVKS